jgi:hypothetical protein
MIDYLTVLTAVGFVTLELCIIVVLYRRYITSWNAEKWQEKAREDNFLLDILSPVITSITDTTSEQVIERIKYELLASQGTMARQVMSDQNIESPEEMMMALSDGLLKSIGYKNPNPLITMKLAQGIGVIGTKVLNQPNQSPDATDQVKTGSELLQSL